VCDDVVVLRCGDGLTQHRAEPGNPHEDQREADDLERRESHAAHDEGDDRRNEKAGDAERGRAQSPGGPRARDREHENAEERQHHARGGALVECGVHVERDQADGCEVPAEGHDECDEQPRGVLACADDRVEPASDVGEGASHAQGEQDEHRSRRHRASVEDGAREVAVSAEFAEVEVPPGRVARGRDGDRGRERQQSDGGHREVLRVRFAQCPDRAGSRERRDRARRVELHHRRHRAPKV
jgi:hypothetical protein